MFRSSLAKFARISVARPAMAVRPLAAQRFAFAPRFYSDGPAPLTKDFVFERISGLLKGYDKVSNNK